MNKSKSEIPVWYWSISSFLLLWNLLGIIQFFMLLSISEETLSKLSDAERVLYENYPFFIKLAFALAVFGGVAGCLALLLRKGWAKMILILSFISVLIQMVHYLFINGAIEVYGFGALAMPIVITLFSGFLVWMSIHADKKNWIK